MITRQIGHAMATQLDRVNNTTKPASPPILSARSTAAERALAKELAAANARIAEMEAQLRDLLAGTVSGNASGQVGGLALDSRPVMSVKDAAHAVGRSVSTVTRYLNEGRWQGRKDDAGNWLVYADQPLKVKRG